MNYSPESHSLCGVLTYAATFNMQPVTTTSEPFAYIESDLKILLESDDRNLIGKTQPYVLTAEFSLFPQASNSEAPSVSETENVTFIDPCLAPFKFNPTTQQVLSR